MQIGMLEPYMNEVEKSPRVRSSIEWRDTGPHVTSSSLSICNFPPRRKLNTYVFNGLLLPCLLRLPIIILLHVQVSTVSNRPAKISGEVRKQMDDEDSTRSSGKETRVEPRPAARFKSFGRLLRNIF